MNNETPSIKKKQTSQTKQHQVKVQGRSLVLSIPFVASPYQRTETRYEQRQRNLSIKSYRPLC